MDGMPYTIFTIDDEQVAGMLEINDECGGYARSLDDVFSGRKP